MKRQVLPYSAFVLCLAWPSAAGFEADSVAREASLQRGMVGPARKGAGAPDPKNEEGPEAAIAFERSLRGPHHNGSPEEAYPNAKPVRFESLANIIPMTPSFWTPQQLLDDFKKNRTPEQVAILVVIKTELCSKNEHRVCSVTTAAFEKRSTPLLKKFRIYGAWVKGNENQVGPKWSDWESKVIETYHFVLGPGARVEAILPNGEVSGSDASALELSLAAFEANHGATPVLEENLKIILNKVQPPPAWKAPDFTLNSLAGTPVSLSQYAGKVVLLYFWAAGCGPCEASTPTIIELQQKYASQGLVVLGIDATNTERRPGDIARYVKQEGVPYPVLLDTEGRAQHLYRINDWPAFLLIDNKGFVVGILRSWNARGHEILDVNIQQALSK